MSDPTAFRMRSAANGLVVVACLTVCFPVDAVTVMKDSWCAWLSRLVAAGLLWFAADLSCAMLYGSHGTFSRGSSARSQLLIVGLVCTLCSDEQTLQPSPVAAGLLVLGAALRTVAHRSMLSGATPRRSVHDNVRVLFGGMVAYTLCAGLAVAIDLSIGHLVAPLSSVVTLCEVLVGLACVFQLLWWSRMLPAPVIRTVYLMKHTVSALLCMMDCTMYLLAQASLVYAHSVVTVMSACVLASMATLVSAEVIAVHDFITNLSSSCSTVTRQEAHTASLCAFLLVSVTFSVVAVRFGTKRLAYLHVLSGSASTPEDCALLIFRKRLNRNAAWWKASLRGQILEDLCRARRRCRYWNCARALEVAFFVPDRLGVHVMSCGGCSG
jgi:hypothetical protein